MVRRQLIMHHIKSYHLTVTMTRPWHTTPISLTDGSWRNLFFFPPFGQVLIKSLLSSLLPPKLLWSASLLRDDFRSCITGMSPEGIYRIQPLAFLLNTCWDDITTSTTVPQACISASFWYRIVASSTCLTLTQTLFKKYLLSMLKICEDKIQYYTSQHKNTKK